MSSAKPEGRIVLAVATVAMLIVYGLPIPGLFRLVLTVLYFVNYGYLIERGWLPREWWPFARPPNLLHLAISAACLVAALASALGVLFFRTNQTSMLIFGVLMTIFMCGGLFFYVKGIFSGEPRR